MQDDAFFRTEGRVVVGASRIGAKLEHPARHVNGTGQAAVLSLGVRNLSVHTYNEALAEAIFSRLGGHAEVIAAWLGAMERGAKQALGEV